ncbi:MAG: endonuclease MutS2 [Ignavibacteriales bacterium CG12_big_fil_rev_8_21_14_0_65_30_8]|nr:MAG: endonuclease MutS2 [Ignavibacteriales bacterium CG12_big_fil_rev_8_21_14_0_65_30_8]
MESSLLRKLEFDKVLKLIEKYCSTENGKDHILKLKPLTSKEKILCEGNLVIEAKRILIEDNNIPIEYLVDLNESISRSAIEGSILVEKKILQILKLMEISRAVFNYIKNHLEIAKGLYEQSKLLFIDKLFESHITKILKPNGEVKDSASTELNKIRSLIKEKEDELRKSVQRIIKSLEKNDIVQEDYVTLRDGRIVLPVKAEHKRHIKGFIHSESATGQTVYIEPSQTLELNNDIITLKFSERREIERILKSLTKKIGEVKNELKQNLDIITYLDSIFARAKYSFEIKGSFPSINIDKEFLVINGQHPLLLQRLGFTKAVPLDLKIQNDKIIIITGPNAGGKTVVLKTLGLLSLMVQSGIHIPAGPDSNFWIFKNIYVDIGDEQSLEDDLSTFSSHLKNINNIISQAGKDSLILLDEIGTGTDPIEGSALASAILLTLEKINSVVLATTHHGNLKLLADSINAIQNASMQFDQKNLKPTYILKQGLPGSSYAFEIAKRLGFDEKFFKIAKQNLDPDKHKVEKFLTEIEKKNLMLSQKLKYMEIENARLKGLSNLYETNINKLKNEKNEIINKAKKDADVYLKEMNKEIESVVKKIKETKAEKSAIKESKTTINKLKETTKIEKQIEEEVIDNTILELGDWVKIKDSNTIGEIIEINSSKKHATILTGGLKINTSLESIVKTQKVKDKTIAYKYHFDVSEIKVRLDIRGKRPDEAEYNVVKFMDEAYFSGQQKVEILHGKGTGVLRKLVGEILSKSENVKTFYSAPIEIGGDGITIAELN